MERKGPQIPYVQDQGMEAVLNIETRTFYQAANGDRWMLTRTTEGAVSVMHVTSTAAGGHSFRFELEHFLTQERDSPQLCAFLQLIGTLIERAVSSEV